jgi:hypothetical protein
MDQEWVTTIIELITFTFQRHIQRAPCLQLMKRRDKYQKKSITIKSPQKLKDINYKWQEIKKNQTAFSKN